MDFQVPSRVLLPIKEYRLRLSRTLVAAILIALLLSGCASSQTKQQEAVRRTILRYDDLLTQGYRSMNMNPMAEVATDLQAQDEYIHMSSLAEGGVRLDPELKDIQFVKVSVEATSAKAETRETWDYKQYSRADGKLALVQKGLIYELAWDLVRKDQGHWLVEDVRAISATSTAQPEVIETITPVEPGK